MPVRRDILATLPHDERVALMKRSVMGILGPVVGDQVWKQMEPALSRSRRQPGDAPAPEDNYWKGVWRIYEAD